MRLRVCPFSVAVFFGTAAYVAYRRRKEVMGSTESKSIEDQRQNDEKEASKETKKKKLQVVFVLGGPGAGKGTQCQLLEQRLGGGNVWKHLSAGDLLRAERKRPGSELGELINERIAAGALVPSEVTCQLLLNAMEAEETCTKFLIDGFPRSKGNLDAWNNMNAWSALTSADQQPSNNVGKVTVEFVLSLECPEDVLTGRLLERGKQGSGRVDDGDLDVIRKRFQTHQKETQPILDYYDKGTLHRIASDQPVEQVYQQIAPLFEKL